MRVIKWGQDILLAVGASVLGLVSVIMPPLLLSGAKQYDHPVWPAVVTGIEGMSWLTILFLGLSGMIIGLLRPKQPWRWGVMTMVPFPLLTFIDLSFSICCHSIWPIELIMYFVLTTPGIVGAFIGAIVSRCVKGIRPIFSFEDLF